MTVSIHLRYDDDEASVPVVQTIADGIAAYLEEDGLPVPSEIRVEDHDAPAEFRFVSIDANDPAAIERMIRAAGLDEELRFRLDRETQIEDDPVREMATLLDERLPSGLATEIRSIDGELFLDVALPVDLGQMPATVRVRREDENQWSLLLIEDPTGSDLGPFVSSTETEIDLETAAENARSIVDKIVELIDPISDPAPMSFGGFVEPQIAEPHERRNDAIASGPSGRRTEDMLREAREFDESAVGGAFDGRDVSSDADTGL